MFTLSEPLNIFPKFLAMPVAAIVPAPTPAGFDQAPVGSGPWRFVSWSHDDAMVFARNPTYWAGPPKEDTLTVRIIPEALTEAAEYETGNLDVVEIPFSETRRWEMAHPDELQRRPTIRDFYIAINTTRGPLKDVRVRRALNLATDVGTLLRTVMADRGVRAAGAIPPGILGFDSTRAPYPWDTAGARRLLAEAGYAKGFRLQLWRSKRSELARIAQSVQQDLALVGIQVEIVERDAPSVRATVRNGGADLYLGDWYADYPDPENFSFPLFHSSNKGTGGQLRLPERHGARCDDHPLADHVRYAGEGAAGAGDRRARLRPRAVDLPLVSRSTSGPMQPDVKGWRIPAVFTGQRWMQAERIK